jgi:hypothetical protein
MTSREEQEAEAMFEKALGIAETSLDKAMETAGDLSDYVAVAMIEAAVNRAVELTSHADIVDMLRDLADQIEDDADGEDGEDA